MSLHNTEKYELIKPITDEDMWEWSKDSKFQATLASEEKLNLVTNFKNGLLLRIIHEGYAIQRH
jgi:hypothetical protein